MTNRLITMFTEWLMLIYYFHLFSRSNKSKITYNENSCQMPILSFKSILFFRGNHRQYLKRESPSPSECLVFYKGVLNRSTFSIHQSIDVRLIISLRHEFRRQEKYFRQNLNGTVTLKEAYPLPTRPQSRIFENFFPMARKAQYKFALTLH